MNAAPKLGGVNKDSGKNKPPGKKHILIIKALNLSLIIK